MAKTTNLHPFFVLVVFCFGCSKPENETVTEPPPPKPQKSKPANQPKESDSNAIAVEDELEELFKQTDHDEEPFLQTDMEDLENWFEDRFKVELHAMTPNLIFDEVPLNDIHYELDDQLSEGDYPKFNYSSGNISRRELLKEIEEFWNLKIVLVDGDDGNPSVVKVMDPNLNE